MLLFNQQLVHSSTAMPQSRLELIVQKLRRYKGKLLVMKKFKDLVVHILWDSYSDQKLYKLAYQLKHKGYLISLKKDIFLVKEPDATIHEQQIIDQHYRSILKKHINQYLPGKRYIWWLKALELHCMNFSAPDEILLVSESKQSTEILMFEKKLLCKRYTSRKQNLFRSFYWLAQKYKIWPNAFHIATIELAILETLYSPNIVSQWYAQTLIKKLLKSYYKSFDLSVIEKVLSLGKHHSSTQRLYDLIGRQHKDIGNWLITLMKKYSY